MRTKKIIAVLLATFMLFSLMACTNNNNQDNSNNQNNDASDTNNEDNNSNSLEDTQNNENTSEENVTISFWKWIPVDGLQTDQLTEAWEEQYPNITLDIVHVGESSAHFQKLSAAMASGEGPSVLALQVGAVANQYKEFSEPLRPYAEERWGEEWEDMFLEAALEQCRYSGDDYTVLPGGMTATPVIQYNATALKELGFSEAPETMEDVYEIIEASKENPDIIPGVGIGAKEGWTCRDVFMGIVNQIAPGKIYEAQEGEVAFTEAEFVEAFEIWKNLFDSGFFAEGSLGVSLYPDINDNFNLAGTNGERYYIMQNCGTWHGSGLTTESVENGVSEGTRAEGNHYGFFTLPAVKEGTEPNMVVTVDVAWGVNNSKSQEEKDAAFKFVAWMAAEEGQTIWTNTLQVLPGAKGIDLSKAKNDMYGETEKEALEMAQHYVENNAGPREIRYAEIANELNDALVAVAGGIMTPEEACEALQRASEQTTR